MRSAKDSNTEGTPSHSADGKIARPDEWSDATMAVDGFGMREGNLGDSAYLRLREDIVTCRLEPGAHLTEGGLSDYLNMSKAPVRVALSRLVQGGLVIAIPRQGYRIAPVTLRDSDELFAMRFLLETEAARLAAGRIDVEPLRSLDGVCRAGYQAGDRKSQREFLRANREFHIAIAMASGNRRLAAAVKSILEEIERVQHVGMTTQDRSVEIRHEHSELLDVLQSGDGEKAATLMRDQIDAARQMVLNALISNTAIREAGLTIAKEEGETRPVSMGAKG